MPEVELRARADVQLEHLDSDESHMQKEHHVAQAQIYLAELDRRAQERERNENARIARRDFWMEIAVIVLIGAELIVAEMAYFGESKQMAVLDQLNRSSGETADTLTAVRKAQEASVETQQHTLGNIMAMNDAVQDQIDFNFTEAIQGSGMSAPGHQEISFGNRGGIVLILWGSKFGSDPPTMRERPLPLASGSSTPPIDVTPLVEKTIRTMGTETRASIPFELYLKRQNGTKYVAKGTLQVNRNNTPRQLSRIT